MTLGVREYVHNTIVREYVHNTIVREYVHNTIDDGYCNMNNMYSLSLCEYCECCE